MDSRSPSRTAPSLPAAIPIACVSIPRFAVEAERQRRKDIGSRLVLIGEAIVYDYSLGAEASNVKRGMRMSEAIGLCHRAVVLPPDLPYYQRLFGQVLDFLEEMSPQVEPGETGLAYLSLRGAETLISSLHRAFGFMSSIGVAGGKFPARVAAVTGRPGASKVIEPGAEAAFLAPLSIEHLPVDDGVRWRLHLLGLDTLGDIAALPAAAFQAQFGAEGKRWWELARGIDAEPLQARVKEQTVVRRVQLPAAALDSWIRDAASNELKPFQRTATTLQKWRSEVLNYWRYPITNALVEGKHNRIKVMKRRGYGYRNDRAFMLRLLSLNHTD